MGDPHPQPDFEAVILPHTEAVYRMARRLAGNQPDAEDLVQETFLRALRAFDSFQLRPFGPKPWLMKILHNVFYSRLERQARAPLAVDDAVFDGVRGEPPLEAAPASEHGRVDWEQFDDRIKDAVSRLPPDFREPLLLWALEDLRYKEIAEVCGTPLGTVMSRLHRARELLVSDLTEYARDHRVPGHRAAGRGQAT